MIIKYFGHSAFLVDIGKKILFDPWLKGNPWVKEPVEVNADYIFVSHSHSDHGLEDAINISQKTDVPIISIFELANYAKQKGARAIGGNIGGIMKVDELEVFLTPALHSSSLGSPVGFIVKYNGKTLYHAGDTGYFAEMKFLGERFNIDVAFLPIGGTFTMGVEECLFAIKDLKPRFVVPMHYNTFPAIKAEPQRLKEKVENTLIVEPGQELKLEI